MSDREAHVCDHTELLQHSVLKTMRDLELDLDAVIMLGMKRAKADGVNAFAFTSVGQEGNAGFSDNFIASIRALLSCGAICPQCGRLRSDHGR